MSLSDVSNVIAAISVAASLIYMAFQTHQGVKQTKALIHQGRVANTIALTAPLLDPRIAAVMPRKYAIEPTDEAIADWQFDVIFERLQTSWQDSFEQYRAGLLDVETFDTTRKRIASSLAQPTTRALWERRNNKGEFAAFVVGIISTLPPMSAALQPEAARVSASADSQL
jgi:hypothetical protein